MTNTKLLRRIQNELANGTNDLDAPCTFQHVIDALWRVLADTDSEDAPRCPVCGYRMAIVDDPGSFDEWRCPDCGATADDGNIT